MADIMSKEQRSKTMSKIKAKSKLEDMFASALWRKGLRFRRNVRSLKGTPDIAIKKYKIAYSSILASGTYVQNISSALKAMRSFGTRNSNEMSKGIRKFLSTIRISIGM